MLNDYTFVVLIASALLAVTISGRLAYFLASTWKLSSEMTGTLTVFGAAAAAILIGTLSIAVQTSAGVSSGIVLLVLTAPLVSLSWILIVGIVKAVERILSGLMAKLN